MYFRTWCSLLFQRARENEWIFHSALVLLVFAGFAQALAGQTAKALQKFSQVHRSSRWRWMQRLVESYILRNRHAFHIEPQPSESIEHFFGNRLMVLKAPSPGIEKGVLLVMFSETFQLLYSCMDMQKVLKDYTIVFEPSWSGYCDSGILQFTRYADQIFVMAAQKDDFAFLRRLDSNLVPVELGPCDWVDPRIAFPYLQNPKEFDIVMNSHWGALKRHYALFRMLRSTNRKYKVALIGGSWVGRNRTDVERLAAYYDVKNQLTYFEQIPYPKVMDVTCRSRVSILLSLKEGSNRAIAESIFCNVPVVVLIKHIGGITKNVVPETGLLVDERNMDQEIARLLRSNLRPRNWGVEHISCFKSSDKLNDVLREHALNQGHRWVHDIAARSSSPESKYVFESDAERLRSWNDELTRYLRNG